MAHIRRLRAPGQKPGEPPKGKWQATVRHPSGQRYSKSDPLKLVVKKWADDQEAAMRRGEFVDPAAGQITLTDWWERWAGVQVWATATREKNVSWWRNHIAPRFGSWPLVSIKSWDVEAWVKEMQDKGVGATTGASSLRLLGQVLTAAVNARPPLLSHNPAMLVTAATPAKHVDRTLTRDEADRLLEQFTGPDRVFVEALLYCGLRWQEAAGLRRFRVDLLRKRLQVARVQPRKGGEKKPKTAAGTRLVPLTDELVVQLSRLIPAPDEDLVFASQQGQPLRYGNWLRRVWYPALVRAKLLDPQPTPHDLRHTYGSWLGEAGVPQSQIAALMGHGSLRSAERYIHATEARFEQARAALQSGRRAAGPLTGEGPVRTSGD